MPLNYVFDASAVLAVLLGEPGSEKIGPELSNSCWSAVNAAEAADKLARLGAPREGIERTFRGLRLEIVPADLPLALEATDLFMPTRRAGLSLGDRFCLGLAKQRGWVALTSDRQWAGIADSIGVKVELFR